MFGDEATFHQKGGTPMNYVGIDYHKKYSHVTAIDEEGRVIRSRRLENKPDRISVQLKVTKYED